MKKTKRLICSFDWHSNPTRDREIITPVLNYLKLRGFEVISANILDFRRVLRLHSPSYAIFTNVVGSEINYSVAKYMKLKGVKIISLISEGYFGDFEDQKIFPIYSNCKINFVDRLLVWNKKSLDFLG
jgi:hypothetical protein